MKFNWTVFAVAFVFNFVVGVLSYWSFYLRWLHLSPQMFDWLAPFIQVGNFIISPLLLFACFYFIGRNIDLASDFLSVFVSLFIASWAGHLVSFLLIFQPWDFAPSTPIQTILMSYLWVGFTMAFYKEFFIGFTALAMAYIVKKRLDYK